MVVRTPEAGRRQPKLLSLPAVFRDVHNLVLEDEKVGSALTGQAHHMLIVVLDPAAHRLTIHQLDADRFLLLAQSFKKAGFFEGLFWRRGPAALGGVGVSLRAERHAGIVHGARERQMESHRPEKRWLQEIRLSI